MTGDYYHGTEKTKEGLQEIARAIASQTGTPEERMALATAIENGLLALAESIKYATDNYVELHQPPEKPEKVLVSTYQDWLDFHNLSPVPFRPVRVGDIISPTGKGLSGGAEAAWAGKNRVARVTSAGGSSTHNSIHWEDVLNGETQGGVFNDVGRFVLYE